MDQLENQESKALQVTPALVENVANVVTLDSQVQQVLKGLQVNEGPEVTRVNVVRWEKAEMGKWDLLVTLVLQVPRVLAFQAGWVREDHLE